jgi:hypothetical protein
VRRALLHNLSSILDNARRMTKTRRLTSGIGLLLMIALAILILSRRQDAPPFTVTFLRYEDGGDTAVLQVTNLSGSLIAYSCFAALTGTSSSPAVASWAAAMTGVVKPRQDEEVSIKFVAKQRPSKVRLHYLPMDTRYRLKHRLGLEQDSFEVSVKLPRPPSMVGTNAGGGDATGQGRDSK